MDYMHMQVRYGLNGEKYRNLFVIVNILYNIKFLSYFF